MHLPLQGYSGCTIQVKSIGASHRLIKSSSNPDYAPRLVRQAEKQMRYRKLAQPDLFRVPEIYSIEKTENGVAVEMEYIRGMDAIDFLSTADPERIGWLQQMLIRCVDFFHGQSAMQAIDTRTLCDKLHSVAQTIRADPDKTLFLPVMDRVETIFSALPPTLDLPVGCSHGDLTLSNILIDPSGPHLLLIDFLDNIIETPVMDMVKLRQDSLYHWSCNLYRDIYPTVRLQSVMSHMDAGFDKKFRQYPYYITCYRYFQLLNLLRIVPYVSEKRLLTIVLNALESELAV